MKTQTTLVIAISALLASCGGSSGSDSVLAANDGFETPVFTPTPVNNGGTNTGGTDTGGTDTGGTDTGGTDTGGTDTGGTDTGGTDTGGTDTGGNIVIDDTSSAISELFGQFSLVYGFTGDEQVFILTSPFSATDVQLADDGSEVLFGTARFASRLTPDAEFVEGATQTLGCIFLGEIDNFLCLADVGERMESWYLFDRLVDDAALGTWEFCNGVEDCAAELVNAPDGDIVALVTPPAVASARSLELDQASKTDLIPYLQYLDQGTENSTITARSSTSEAGAIAAGVATLRESIK